MFDRSETLKMDEENLDDYMEAVTTYKCKFCTFTAASTQDMGIHVRSVHMVTRQPAQTISTGQKLVSLVYSSPNDSSTRMTIYQRPEDPVQVSEPFHNILSSNNGTGQTSVDSLTQTMPQPPVSLSNDILNSVSNSMETAVLDSKTVQTAPSISADNRLGEYAFISQGPTGQIFVENSGDFVLVQRDAEQDPSSQTGLVTAGEGGGEPSTQFSVVEETSIADELLQSTIAEKTQSMSQNLPDDMKSADVTEQNKEDDLVLTKELYLCGTCSEGFTTIQECKVHMVQQHDVVEFQSTPSVTTATTTAVGGKVDAETQVEPRKRGRKKKSEIAEERARKEAEEGNEAEKVEEEIKLSDSDEDWTESLHAPVSRGKRKRGPPRALKQDYYLGHKKPKEAKKKTCENPSWGLVCRVKGCGLRFKEGDLEKHMTYHVTDSESRGPMFRCTECTDSYQFWKPMKLHLWICHKIDVGMFGCPVCQMKLDSHYKLRVHMETHGTERPYVCIRCNKAFKQFAQLKNHQYTHLGKDVAMAPEYANSWHTPKTCHVCGRKFANMKCMRKHVETVHNEEKKFKCTYCDHACSRKSMLVLHLRTHTGEKPFKCTECRYATSDHNALRRHTMRHTGDKPYRCQHCPYACIQAISLKVHVKNKHPGLSGGVYSCNLCQYRTVNETQYKNHCLDHENGLIEAESVSVIDNQGVVKNPNSRARKARPLNTASSQPTKQVMFTDISGQSSVLQVMQAQGAATPQVIQLPVSMPTGQEQVAHLQIQLNESSDNSATASENYISAEDYAKLTSLENTSQTQPDEATANLIYSALSAISLQSSDTTGETVDPQELYSRVENGDIQTSIESNSNKDGVITHTITFRLPDDGEIIGGVTLQETAEESKEMNEGTEFQLGMTDTDWTGQNSDTAAAVISISQ